MTHCTQGGPSGTPKITVVSTPRTQGLSRYLETEKRVLAKVAEKQNPLFWKNVDAARMTAEHEARMADSKTAP